RLHGPARRHQPHRRLRLRLRTDLRRGQPRLGAGTDADRRAPQRNRGRAQGAGREMSDFLQLLISGTAVGAIYALAALGFTLLWQASGTINFAQGEFVMVPAFITLVCLGYGMPLPLAFVVTCL